MFGKNKIAALVAEFLGTGILTLLILSVQRTQLGIPLFVGMTAGLALIVVTFALARASGAHFNPAVTLGMWTARKIPSVTALLYIIVQILGAYGAYLLFRYFATKNVAVLQSFDKQAPEALKFSMLVMVSEAVGAAIFAFGWASAVYQRFTPAVSATLAGLAYAVGIIAAGSASLGLLNPAVAMGAHVWMLGEGGTWLNYALGPVVGAVIGINLYGLVFADAAEAATVGAGSAPAPAIAAVGRPKKEKAAVKKPVAKKKTSTRTKKK
jgi:glycerol uptake facilitator protein